MEQELKKKRISDAEWEVMRVIWNKETSDAREIYELLNEAMDWKMATIKTLLGRLVQKEALATEKIGKKFFYRPLITEREVAQAAFTDTLIRICATQRGQAIGDLLATVSLTTDDIQRLMDQLANKKPQPVECTCLPGQCRCHQHLVKGSEER